MLKFRTLEGFDLSLLHLSFQKAFDQYLLPMDPRAQVHLHRWETSGVDFSLSYGAFDGDQLVGFILHVPEGSEVFNLATGVVPSHRGQRIIDRLYAQALSELREKGFTSIGLEVIAQNGRAIEVYSRLGFRITRRLHSFRGEFAAAQGSDDSYAILPYVSQRSLPLHYYAFEQRDPVLLRLADELEIHELRHHSEVKALCVWRPGKAQILQLEARSPFDDNVRRLFTKMKLLHETLGMINVDGDYQELCEFWERHKFVKYVSQLEMRKVIS